jgi:hypothetical protein
MLLSFHRLLLILSGTTQPPIAMTLCNVSFKPTTTKSSERWRWKRNVLARDSRSLVSCCIAEAGITQDRLGKIATALAFASLFFQNSEDRFDTHFIDRKSFLLSRQTTLSQRTRFSDVNQEDSASSRSPRQVENQPHISPHTRTLSHPQTQPRSQTK